MSGLSPDGARWIASRPNFLFPVEVMGKLMRGKFLDGLVRLRRSGAVTGGLCSDDFSQLIHSLYDLDWNVYSKAPFTGPKCIFRYLAHYTHRTGISNSRLVAMSEQGVTFRTHGDDTVTLAPQLLILRFLTHVLPHGFVRLRHYGLMANGHAVKRRVSDELPEPSDDGAWPDNPIPAIGRRLRSRRSRRVSSHASRCRPKYGYLGRLRVRMVRVRSVLHLPSTRRESP